MLLNRLVCTLKSFAGQPTKNKMPLCAIIPVSLRTLSSLQNYQAIVDHATRILTLQSEGASKNSLHYPLAWLRDNCQCPKCHNPHSDSRQLLMNSYSPYSKVTQTQIGTGKLHIVWCDGHESSYPIDWLSARHFTESGQAPRDPHLDKTQPRLWHTHPYRLEFFDFQTAMSDDAAMLRVLLQLETDGLVFLDNCGTDESVVSRLCKRIAYPRRTHYGITFRVESKTGPSNLAYTNAFLGFHSDLPYFLHQPDLQVLHCVRQTEIVPGGENLFCDAFSAADLLRERHPELFEVLSRVKTNFRDRNSDDLDRFYLVEQHPVLELDSQGKLCRVHFSNQQRDSVLNIPIGQVQLYYEALKTFNTLLYDDGLRLEKRLANGQLVVFENGRVLHSRNAYQGSRLYIGAYLSWDETLSRRRVLQGLL